MGDRYERSRRFADTGRPWLRLARPPALAAWGLPAPIGHNNGPPLDDEPNDIYVRYKWRRAHAEAWKTPSMSVLRFRVARAEAAGVSYEAYMSELLDTGRHLQRSDVEARARRAGDPPGGTSAVAGDDRSAGTETTEPGNCET